LNFLLSHKFMIRNGYEPCLSMPSGLKSAPPPPTEKVDLAKVPFWRRIGGGSLGVSLFIHGALMVLAAIWIYQVIPKAEAPEVDFLAQGGGGGESQRTMVHQKKRAAMMAEAPRIAAHGVTSSFTLPESSTLPSLASTGEKPSSLSGGLGGSGTGGGRGSGTGSGVGGGLGSGLGGPGGFSGVMFGTQINARTIGVVLDVSSSMVPYLPAVIKELDRVAPGSPLVLYVGCGIGPGRPKGRSYTTAGIDGKRFERFWRIQHEGTYRNKRTMQDGSDTVKVDFSTPLPHDDVFKILVGRPNTYYFEFEGTEFSWAALTSDQLRSSEAVYWFADFQDPVQDKEAETVMKKLRNRRQKLFIHGSIKGSSYETVRKLISEPSGGRSVETK
jgi:hypothetical protein